MPQEPKPKSLTHEEIEQLPHWFAVALASRCAMRVQPLVTVEAFAKTEDPQEIAQHIAAVDAAITLPMVATRGGVDVAAAAAAAAAAADDAYAVAAAAVVAYAVDAPAAAAYAVDAVAAAYGVDAPANTGREHVHRANREDWDWLKGQATYADPNSIVSVDFWQRPLWSVSSEWLADWGKRIDAWERGLVELDRRTSGRFELSQIVDRHRGMLGGRGVDLNEATARLDRWLRDRGDEAEPGKKETKKKTKKKEASKHKPVEREEEAEGDAPPTDENPAGGTETATPTEPPQPPEPPEPPETPEPPDSPEPHDYSGAATAVVDEPAVVDRLGREALVNSLSEMFTVRSQATPFTMALLGDWGAGKSSVLAQMRERLRYDPKTKRVRWLNGYVSDEDGDETIERFYFAQFNAWEYEHTDDVRAGLAQEVVNGLVGELGWWGKVRLQFRFACRQHGWEMVKAAVGLVGAGLAGVSVWWVSVLAEAPDWARAIAGSGGVVFFSALVVILYQHFKPIWDHPLATELRTYLKLPDYGEHLGTIPVMKAHVRALCELQKVRKGGSRRLIVFVDDLDRCGHGCITATLDAIRLVMDVPNVIVVVAIDDRIAFRAVARHYREMADKVRTPEMIARDYLGKIIQLPVKLSKPRDMSGFIREQLFPTVEDEALEAARRAHRDRPVTEREVFRRLEILRDAESSSEGEPPVSQDRVVEAASAVQAERESDGAPLATLRFRSMADSAEDCATFERLTGYFRITNPRRLIRLRNTFRLLAQLNERQRFVESQTQAAGMLFWLDFLNQFDATVRGQCVDWLLQGPAPPAGLVEAAREIVVSEDSASGAMRGDAVKYLRDILFGGDEVSESDVAGYHRIARIVERFVLPHGPEGAALTSEPAEDG